jgi:hypothetical protein
VSERVSSHPDGEVLQAGKPGSELAVASWRGRGRVGGLLLVAGVTGALVGGSSLRAWDNQHPPGPTPAARPAIDLRVSLGARTGGLDGVEDGRAIVALTTVILNAGSEPLTLTGVEVNGPGAGFVASPPGGPSTGLPRELPPGQFVDVRFGLASDCSVAVRPLPHVSMIVRDPAGGSHDVAVRIPDLDTIWGESLAPGACVPAT